MVVKNFFVLWNKKLKLKKKGNGKKHFHALFLAQDTTIVGFMYKTKHPFIYTFHIVFIFFYLYIYKPYITIIYIFKHRENINSVT